MTKKIDAARKRQALRAFMTERGIKPKPWAERAGLSPNTLYNFLNGESERLESETYQKLADAERVPVFVIDGTINITKLPSIIHVLGRVQAGAWLETNAWHEDDTYAVSTVIEDYYRNCVFGLEVVGESMNALYPEGSIVICVPILEFRGELRTGVKVVCERMGTDGLKEVTVKELVIDDEGESWLWPRSNSPLFQSPVAWDNHDTDTVSVSAVVIFSQKREV